MRRQKEIAGDAADGQRLGYARVSTHDQNLDLQLDALRRAGCSDIYQEHASGKGRVRVELTNILRALRPGDTLVVWKLDRLGRSLIDLVQIIDGLAARGIGFESLTEKLDAHSALGRMFMSFVGMMAEYERNLISERTRAGLEIARAAGRRGGRTKKLSPVDVRQALQLLKDPENSVTSVARRFNVSRATLYTYINETEAGQRKEIKNGARLPISGGAKKSKRDRYRDRPSS